MHVEWLSDENLVDETAAFFANNIDPDPAYISHSELMWGRAVSPDTWTPDLGKVVEREFRELAAEIGSSNKLVARCVIDGELVAVALVAFEQDVPVPFAVLEDIVVAQDRRGEHIGQSLLDWVFGQVRERKIGRIFLESGLNNHGAHHWFERNGFNQVSIVMMASL